MNTFPRWRSSRQVSAVRIKSVERPVMPGFTGALCKGSPALSSACGQCDRCLWLKSPDAAWLIVPAEDGIAPIPVDAEFVLFNNPQPGDYFVRADTGYRVTHPAAFFETQYVRL